MEKVKLDVKETVTGIGRIVTDKELIEYLKKDIDAVPLPLNKVEPLSVIRTSSF